MPWIDTKHWVTGDYFNYTDYNRIINDLLFLSDSVCSNVYENDGTTDPEYADIIANYLRPTADFVNPIIDNGNCFRLVFVWTSSESDTQYVVDYTFYEKVDEVVTKFTRETTPKLWEENGTYHFYSREAPLDKIIFVPPDFPTKAVNDYWFAREINAILDGIEAVAKDIGSNFDNKPYYYPNGSTPTVMELNLIERKLDRLYNQINNPYSIYLGQGGSIGTRITNTLM